jgi:hypothetical protein
MGFACYVPLCKNACTYKKPIDEKKVAEYAAQNVIPGPKHPFKLHKVPKVSITYFIF